MKKRKIRNMDKHVYQLLVELKYIQPVSNQMGLLGKQIVRSK